MTALDGIANRAHARLALPPLRGVQPEPGTLGSCLRRLISVSAVRLHPGQALHLHGGHRSLRRGRRHHEAL
jgi:hypothetical protein